MKQSLNKIPYRQLLTQEIVNQCEIALAEDLAGTAEYDITASLIPAGTQAHAEIICREQAVFCGQAWLEEIFQQLNQEISIHWFKQDGDTILAGEKLCKIEGDARALLTGERSAMNFLQTLSATATQTASYIKAMNHPTCQLLDTRKTLPGMRYGQKYAVLCGGGTNHRLSLTDRFLIKENHILACDGIAKALEQARATPLDRLIEIEVESIEELNQALEGGADIIMLDNFSLEKLRQAVKIKVKHSNQPILEASGNVNLQSISSIASTGVDCISVGAITKDIKAIDLSMRITNL